ncbi:MAG: pyridoxamine kinase [Firmicutes bacterium]|nr:pyridoxamine kinase [Bacillota bacterium]
MSEKYLPRVAAVHDLSGYGKCALTVALPVLSACGVEVCPLCTSLLSANTLFPGFTFLDYTPYMQAHLDHWKKLGLKFDCVYSGFLGSTRQMDYVRQLHTDFDSGLLVVDPVLGDNGLLIPIFDEEMVRAMAGLVGEADCVTPNVTEACLLTGRPYGGAALSRADSERLCRDVLALGCGSVVLTGVLRDGRLINAGIDEMGYFELDIDELPYHQHGTGDLFASTMVGGLLRGHDLRQAVDSAAHFVYDCMEYGHDIPDVFDRGVAFEPLAYRLGSGVYNI